MLRVDFKKMLCRPVDFKGQGPSISAGNLVRYYSHAVNTLFTKSVWIDSLSCTQSQLTFNGS